MRIKLVLLVLLILIAGIIWQNQTKNIKENRTEPEKAITAEVLYTSYTNQKYSFKFRYPESWGIPEEKEILPSQELVYEMKFNSGVEINIYNQMLPNKAEVFLRNYFKEDLKWTKELESNLMGFSSGEVSGLVFQKNQYVLTIAKKGAIDNEVMDLGNSFEWIEE